MHLRLDMYVNGKEYLISEDRVSEDGFEACLNASDAVTGSIARQLRDNGTARMDKDEQVSEEMVEVFWDILDREILASDDVDFCMCLWEGDEHIESAVSLSAI